MSKAKTIREEVVDILNELFGDEISGNIFTIEKTYKNSGGLKTPMSRLKTATRWSAHSEKSTFVSCVGLIMTDFIKEYKNNSCLYTFSEKDNVKFINIYSKKPEWDSDGYVINIDPKSSEITLHINELQLIDDIKVKISEYTPKWLINCPSSRFAVFTCKIHQAWIQMKTINGFDSKEIWETFKLDSYLTKEELSTYYI